MFLYRGIFLPQWGQFFLPTPFSEVASFIPTATSSCPLFSCNLSYRLSWSKSGETFSETLWPSGGETGIGENWFVSFRSVLFERGAHYAAVAGVEHSEETMLASNSRRFTCLTLLSAGVKGMQGFQA